MCLFTDTIKNGKESESAGESDASSTSTRSRIRYNSETESNRNSVIGRQEGKFNHRKYMKYYDYICIVLASPETPKNLVSPSSPASGTV